MLVAAHLEVSCAVLASKLTPACQLCLTTLLLLLLLLQVGLGDLTDSPAYNGGHQPYNEPWVSDTAAAGEAY
jgi:hypothetical protein